MGEPRNRVVQLSRFGGPEGLELVDAPLPSAGAGEVRVRVLASGLEYTDTLIRRHLYPQTASRCLMGYDVIGEIDQLGRGVMGFQALVRVAGRWRHNAARGRANPSGPGCRGAPASRGRRARGQARAVPGTADATRPASGLSRFFDPKEESEAFPYTYAYLCEFH
jgi:NADPH:quinone reductase-like Zn-dependent oxidoreductase